MKRKIVITLFSVALFGAIAISMQSAIPSSTSHANVTPFVPATGAATNCPPMSFTNNLNLAKNPGFENPGPNGASTTWQNGGPNSPPSAAKNWVMHSSNSGATVSSRLEPTTVPAMGGTHMLHFVAGGNEGGVYQNLDSSPSKLMFSAWVYVKRGHVEIQPSGGTTGPTAWNTKTNEWEQLRVCTDGSVPTGMFWIVNEDPNGGDFFADRIEIREIP